MNLLLQLDERTEETITALQTWIESSLFDIFSIHYLRFSYWEVMKRYVEHRRMGTREHKRGESSKPFSFKQNKKQSLDGKNRKKMHKPQEA